MTGDPLWPPPDPQEPGKPYDWEKERDPPPPRSLFEWEEVVAIVIAGLAVGIGFWLLSTLP